MADELADHLKFLWSNEMILSAHLRRMRDLQGDEIVDKSIIELWASSIARADRLDRRISAWTRSHRRLFSLPRVYDTYSALLSLVVSILGEMSSRYGETAGVARWNADPETAFACELNRIGAEESRQLLILMQERYEKEERRADG